MANIEQWVMEIPPITRAWIIASVAISVGVQCQVVSPFHLYFSWKATFGHLQLWRLISTFIYFGPLSINFVMRLFFIMRYSRLLEENSYANRKADYLWLLIVCSLFLLLISPLFTIPILSGSLAFALVYIWAKRNPNVRMSMLGVITIPAPYVPLCLVGISWILYGGSSVVVVADGLGLLVGHIYYFGQDVWPMEMSSSGKGLFETPNLLSALVDGPRTQN
ncbi:Predicted membrane protein [Phaffia rhodozyma]|uniref:Derlin n=1 Tax=Phaffia rhodozyma TaxID=264483 RepID=A0A0F7SR61_PHARH|nr:Predicted membrane protein [Phaffia rhodozyma]